MRRLLLLVCALVAVDTMLYAALTPLLPHFAHDAPPVEGGSGRARRGVRSRRARRRAAGRRRRRATRRSARRPRRPDADGTVEPRASRSPTASGRSPRRASSRVAAARFTWAGAFAWLLAAAPRERRGEVIGTALGAAVFGALFGPVVGAGAALLGRGVVFTGSSPGSPSCSPSGRSASSPSRPEHPSTAAVDARAPELVLRRRARLDGVAVVPLRRALDARAAPPRRLRLGSAGHRRRLARRRRVRDRALAARRANARPPRRADSRASRARSRRRGLGRPRGRAYGRCSTCRS